MITEKLTRGQKMALLLIMILYFVVGFLLIVFFAGIFLGANAAGILALAYLGIGWYLLVKRNGLFYAMGIKHD